MGGGLALGFAPPAAVPACAAASAAATAVEVTPWLVVHPDDSILIRVAHAEMGQGAQTGLAMLVAEELECDWSKVRTEFARPDENLRRNQVWGDMSTGASRSIATSHLYLRQAGATAREMLIAAAAARWQVPASQCFANASTITHQPTGRTVTFGAVAEDAAKLPVPAEVDLKPPSAWKLVGTPRRRLDVAEKVTGQPVYAIDVRLPNMLYAAIRHSPVFGGTPKSIDEKAIAGMKGVRRVVRMPDAVAVIANSWWRAKTALDALPIVWDDRGNAGVSSAAIAETVRAALTVEKGQVGRADGDAADGLARASRCIAAEYTVPYLAHATMEPQTCTAHVRPDGIEIWSPSQDVTTALATAAIAGGVSNDRVVVHGTLLGGGFGRRGAIQEFIRQAVLIAREVEHPVKLVWSREEDIRHDFYRPFGMARMVAGLDAEGMPTAWTIRLAGPAFVTGILSEFGTGFVDRTFLSGLTDEMAYDVPNYLVDYVVRQTPVPLGVWRAINYTQNAFYKEVFHRRDGSRCRYRSVPVSAEAVAQQPEESRGARRRGKESRLVRTDRQGRVSRYRRQRSLRQLLRPGGGGFGRKRQRPRASGRVGARSRARRQSDVGRNADPGRRHLCPDSGARGRDHHQRRRGRAGKFRRL